MRTEVTGHSGLSKTREKEEEGPAWTDLRLQGTGAEVGGEVPVASDSI